MYKNLNEVNELIYPKLSLHLSAYKDEEEGTEYDACRFQLNDLRVIARSSKVTPKKVGQFVTFWKRNLKGVTEPFTEDEEFDFLVVTSKFGNHFGQFVFPKSALIDHKILGSKNVEGKRRFRLYPSWDQPLSKQAISTQKWQLEFFYEYSPSLDLDFVDSLFKKNDS